MYCFFFVFPVTNRKPSQLFITKVKQFQGSSAFTKRSMWTIDQLQQINGIDPNRVSMSLQLHRPALLDTLPLQFTGEETCCMSLCLVQKAGCSSVVRVFDSGPMGSGFKPQRPQP